MKASPTPARQQGIDFARMIAFVAIVLLHTKIDASPIVTMYYESLTRFAVPFFFIVAGYFLKDLKTI